MKLPHLQIRCQFGSNLDLDATVDYREHQSSLLTLVEEDEDILIELPSDFKVSNLVPLDGDGFALWCKGFST